MRAKVYISSTLDIQTYRDALVDTFNMLRDYFEMLRLAEWMIQDTRPPLDICLDEVGKSDIYVLIVGYRYGSKAPVKDLSFTECEYERALADKTREILVFCAAEGIGNIPEETTYPEEFRKFRDRVRTGHTARLKDFKSEEDLKAQLLLVLFDRFRKKNGWTGVSEDAIRYRCDRVNTLSVYKNNVLKQDIYISILYATRKDRPEYFAHRLATYEYRLPRRISLKSGQLIAGQDNEHACLFNIHRSIYESLFPHDPTLSDIDSEDLYSVQQFFGFLARKNINKLFLEFITETLEWNNRRLTDVLRQFFDELHRLAPGSMIVHIAVTAVGREAYEPVQDSFRQLAARLGSITNLGNLEKIKRSDIETWIELEMSVDDLDEIDRMIDDGFGQGSFELDMHETEKKLTGLVSKYRTG